MGEFLEVAKVMVQPTMKLLEMCSSAIGTAYEPKHVRKMADAEAYRIKQLGEAIQDQSAVPVLYEQGKLSISTTDFDDFLKRAEYREKYQLLREQNNIEKIVSHAYRELECAPEIIDKPVDEDWSTRFFGIAKEINSEELQHIWSKILAGEIKKPGSFSMRTLDTIRNLSREEAETFQRVLPFVMDIGGQHVISSSDELLKQFGIQFSDILLLSECGLVNMSLSNNPKVSETDCSFLCSDTVFIKLFGNRPEQKKITYGIHTLSCAGNELCDILTHNSNKIYAIKWAEEIFTKNKNTVTISLHDVYNISNATVNYSLEPFQTMKNETENVK